MKKGIPEKSNESIAMSRKAYWSGKKPLGDISKLAPKRNNKKKKQLKSLKVSVVAEEDEQIGKDGFLHDHKKCIDCQSQSISQQDLEEYFLNDLSNWPTHVTSHMVLESEEIVDPEPKEMPYDWLLEEKDRLRRLDQRYANNQRIILELELEDERAERAEMADRHRMKLEAEMAEFHRMELEIQMVEMADLEDQSLWKDWSPVNFMLKDLSP